MSDVNWESEGTGRLDINVTPFNEVLKINGGLHGNFEC